MKPPPPYEIRGRVVRLRSGNDGTTWPWPFRDDDQDSAAWKARNAPKHLTRADLFELAGIANAYTTMITHPCRSVAETIMDLRRVYRAEDRKESVDAIRRRMAP